MRESTNATTDTFRVCGRGKMQWVGGIAPSSLPDSHLLSSIEETDKTDRPLRIAGRSIRIPPQDWLRILTERAGDAARNDGFLPSARWQSPVGICALHVAASAK